MASRKRRCSKRGLIAASGRLIGQGWPSPARTRSSRPASREESVSSRAIVRIVEVGHAGNHAFCMMLSTMRVALAKRKRRREEERFGRDSEEAEENSHHARDRSGWLRRDDERHRDFGTFSSGWWLVTTSVISTTAPLDRVRPLR